MCLLYRWRLTFAQNPRNSMRLQFCWKLQCGYTDYTWILSMSHSHCIFALTQDGAKITFWNMSWTYSQSFAVFWAVYILLQRKWDNPKNYLDQPYMNHREPQINPNTIPNSTKHDLNKPRLAPKLLFSYVFLRKSAPTLRKPIGFFSPDSLEARCAFRWSLFRPVPRWATSLDAPWALPCARVANRGWSPSPARASAAPMGPPMGAGAETGHPLWRLMIVIVGYKQLASLFGVIIVIWL